MSQASSNNQWKLLYRIGAVAILIGLLFFRRYYGAELSAFNGFGIYEMPETDPVSALEWFEVLQEYPYVGLSWLGMRDIVNYLLVGVFFLALYAALKENNPSLTLIAISFGLVGVGVYLVSNHAFALWGLSQKYAEATTETQRNIYLAAGESLLAAHNPNGLPNLGSGSHISLLLVFIAGLLFSSVSLKSGIFPKTVSIFGLITNITGMLFFPLLVFAHEWHWIAPTTSAPFRIFWYLTSAWHLWKMGKDES